MARRLTSLGITPSALVGHSVGEVAAAVLSGALSLEEGAYTIVARGRIQNRTVGTGKMLAVALSEAEAKRRIAHFDGKVAVSTINRPELVTVAGDIELIDAFSAELEREQIFHRAVRGNTPFHSYLMDPIQEP
jgi:acyl transferase domain-containing protein